MPLTRSPRRAALIALSAGHALVTGHALAQCPGPAIYELGGQTGPICPANIGYQAIAQGRYLNIENTPLSGTPSLAGRIALDRAAVHLHTETLGRVWATDGVSIYGINTANPASPQILGRYSLPATAPDVFRRLRIRGNFLYVAGYYFFYIFDVSNPAHPVLRGTLQPSAATLADLEVLGSYAYVSCHDGAHSMIVVDISNPQQPVEVRRVGSGNREGFRIAALPSSTTLFALTWDYPSAAIERWDISSATNPTLAAANTTLDPQLTNDDDELHVTSSAVCYLNTISNRLSILNPASLSQLSGAIQFPARVRGMNIDTPNAYIARSTGELSRINISSPSTPVVTLNYADIPPGQATRVATLNEGYSVVLGDDDLWFFRTPVNAQPTCFSHLHADAGYQLDPGNIVLITGGTVLTSENTISSTPTSQIMAFSVTVGSSPSVARVGTYQMPGPIQGFDAGNDLSLVRRIFVTAGYAPNIRLHVLNATNLNAMTESSMMSVGGGAGTGPVRYLPGSTLLGTIPRVVIGGLSATQLVSVENPFSPTPLSLLPTGAASILPGLPPTLWTARGSNLYAYDIGTPTAPVLQSSTIVAPGSSGEITDLKLISPFGGLAAVVTLFGDLVKIDTSNAGAPSILQIADINNDPDNELKGLAFDGTSLHTASTVEGYRVLNFTFSAPPREDPNFPIDQGSINHVVPLCPGAPLVLHARFVANPAVSSFQWLKYNWSSLSYVPLSNGPTGTGASISGATSPTLTITTPGAAEVGFYSCQASNACGTSRAESSADVRLGGYANCDNSTTAPFLNVNDFVCFQTRFVAGFAYANCDGSLSSPTLNVNDFICFQTQFVQACR